ncbi:unnamed protein product [Heterobilharzia americana]|nr:unnamed protein product [Heterobilharzia americana]
MFHGITCLHRNLEKYKARMMYPELVRKLEELKERYGDLFQPNAASLSWLKEEVRYYTEENNDPLEDCLADFTRENPAEAAKLNREITSIFEVHSIIQKYWGRI